VTLAALVAATVLVVAPGGPYTTIDAALAAAQPGDTIEVHGGVHPAVVIDKSITLRGVDSPVLDGGGVGDVVSIEAPDVTVEGFRIEHSGTILEKEHAGVTVLAPRAVVRNNQLSEVLFGVFLKHADESIVQGNHIVGYDFDSARRGDGIRSWYSTGIQILANEVEHTRDVIFWFSDDALIKDNQVSQGRYGLHFMYDDGLVVQGNSIEDNSVGVFLMYSVNVQVMDNLLSDSTGPSGYGLGLKEVDNLVVHDNVILRNRIGISFDSTPLGLDAYGRFDDNLVAFNHIGLSFQPSTKRASLTGNSFDRNGEQIEVRGGGDLEGNSWTATTEDARTGNYWSDYVGYDADGDGIGDVAYEPRSLFASLREEHPVLGLFNESPSALAIDFAARAVPNLRPSPRVRDEAPLMSPAAPNWYLAPTPARWQWLLVAVSAVGVASVLVGGLRLPRLRAAALEAGDGSMPALQATGLTKRYGASTVLEGLNLRLERGEALALWGANGAGKTTALRCILGVIRHEGRVLIDGIDMAADPKRVRRAIGYVPQDQQYPDVPLRELVRTFVRLRDGDQERATTLVQRLGLEEHMHKRPAELSGGLRQRLGFAIALIGQPTLLLLDEPTANLDADTRVLVMDLLQELRRSGTSVLFTTHRADEAVELADRVVLLDGGRAVDEGPAGRMLVRREAALLVEVAEGDRERALAVLADGGVAPEVAGGWIVIEGTPPHVVLGLLSEAGIEVTDSIVERGGGR
jgi:nitrous oxidase accessory protein